MIQPFQGKLRVWINISDPLYGYIDSNEEGTSYEIDFITCTINAYQTYPVIKINSDLIYSFEVEPLTDYTVEGDSSCGNSVSFVTKGDLGGLDSYSIISDLGTQAI